MSKIKKTEQEWQTQLSPEQYRICRQKGTESAFTGEYWNCKKSGVYLCACCGEKLFSSEHKFDSGSGWPSFTQPLSENTVTQHLDESHGMLRTEITCQNCDAHLGHVFADGPQPTGLRYCINSIALTLKENK